MQGTILLVDDNSAFIDSIKDILEEESYEVFTAQSGEDAVSLTQSRCFDLVLMDIKMSGMNGVESFLRMKAHHPGIKVVLYTAYALDELIQQARDGGVMAVLKKPLKMDHLIAIIEEAKSQKNAGWVLIADDDRAICENLFDALTGHGYRVAMVCDPLEAIRQVERQAFDVLLLDLKMPKLNGLEVYRRVKILQPNLITILMTGYAEELSDMIHRGIDESAYTLLSKPINMNRLLKLLAQVAKDRESGLIRKPTLE